jgi:lipoate-protein ligase A
MAHLWRLLLDGPGDGAWNMAVDRAIQLARSEGSAPPTLRLYGWRAATLSFGRFQRAEPGLLGRCSHAEVAVVRRPTGGRAVLHDDEITYSVVAGTSDGVPNGTSDSYRHLCAGIVETYSELGVDAELTSRERGLRHGAACYLHATAADVSAGTAKLAGSAQVWHGETCLQHGSFTRTRDVERERAVFDLDDALFAQFMGTTATLEDLLPAVPDVKVVREAVIAGFSRALGVSLREGTLSAAEIDLAGSILDEYEVD